MVYLAIVILLLGVSTLQAIPEPQTTVHIQNYDGPIIVHSGCDNQCLGNQCNKYNKCEPDCTCTTKQSCYPYTPATLQGACYPTVTQTACYPTTTQSACCPTTTQSACYPTTTQSASYPTTTQSCYPMTTSYGCNQYCNADDLKVYSIADSNCNSYNTCSRCGGKSYQCQCVGCC